MCVEMSDKFWDFGTQRSVQMSGQMVLFDWKAGVVVRTRLPQVAKVTLNVRTWTWIRRLVVKHQVLDEVVCSSLHAPLFFVCLHLS